MDELYLIRRMAAVLAAVALLAGALALHALHAERHAGTVTAGATLTGTVPTVTSLRRGGTADRAGLHVGDAIERLDGRVPQSLAEVERTMASGQPADLTIRRDGHLVELVIH